MRKKLVLFIITCIIVGLSLATPLHSYAQILTEIETKATDFGFTRLGLLDTTNPVDLVGNILTYLLSLLGIIFLIIILYAGFTWMLAGGETKRVEKARSLIKNGVIGITIIVLALAIVRFVVMILQTGTGIVSN